ncbi:chitinase-3-like protein 2 [Battus philenor]|uniref:chitinase-3-like protein 2 n=1 Tax=Battus philenor TaxID=42288 RepID=UPI0035D0B272
MITSDRDPTVTQTLMSNVLPKNTLSSVEKAKKSREYSGRTFLLPLVGVALLISTSLSALVIVQIFATKADPLVNSGRYLQQQTNRRVPNNLSNVEKVVSCYYNTPSQLMSQQLLPSEIHPYLCTHINVAFAQIRGKAVFLDSGQQESLAQVVLLKKLNPKLKILLSIGGAHNDSGFPEMIENHASRKVFIKSVKNVLKNYTLDGIDLDWEFPAVHNALGVSKRERQHFSQLLQEIRKEFVREKKDYYLTVAVAAPETIVNVAYDIDQINLYVDYVNIMTYDFHSFSKYTPFTGLNSPLYHRRTEQMYMATLNINYTVHMYLNKGLEENKIVVGIPTYGHTFTLVNADNTGVGSPASGYGKLGGLGFVNYPDICNFIKDFRKEVVVTTDFDAKVPYLQRGQEWVSFDTPQSAMEKATYIRKNNLRGAMIYSLNADDYMGICDEKPAGRVKFPLAVSVKNALTKEIHQSY